MRNTFAANCNDHIAGESVLMHCCSRKRPPFDASPAAVGADSNQLVMRRPQESLAYLRECRGSDSSGGGCSGHANAPGPVELNSTYLRLKQQQLEASEHLNALLAGDEGADDGKNNDGDDADSNEGVVSTAPSAPPLREYDAAAAGAKPDDETRRSVDAQRQAAPLPIASGTPVASPPMTPLAPPEARVAQLKADLAALESRQVRLLHEAALEVS